MSVVISTKQARRLALNAQGLWGLPSSNKSPATLLSVIRQLSYVQIDTISVVKRAHHHTLWTRLSQYEPDALWTQQQASQIFEYWSHAAAFLPIEHFRYSLPKKAELASGKRHWFPRKPEMMDYVLDRIRAEGPLQSKDFEHPPGSGGTWYDWKPAKRSLEQLFMEGRLMIRERRGFQKVFDLTERVLPAGVDTRMPSQHEMARHLIQTCLQAHGLATDKQIAYLRKGMRGPVKAALAEMVEQGEILACEIKGLAGVTWYAFTSTLEKASLRQRRRHLYILSPFDNAVIQRERLSQLFGFQYQIECYVPKPKRVYGYFCLPLLWGDEFVGRLDAKADRKSGILIVKSLYLENQAPNSFLPELANQLHRFAAFNGCDHIRVESVQPVSYVAALRQLVA